MKVCSKCKKEKFLSEFGKNKARKDGHEHRCRLCRKEIDAERYKKNKEKILAKNKEWRDSNPEAVKNRASRYYKENKEKILEMSKEYYDNNKDAVLRRHADWRENNMEYHDKYREENAVTVKEAERRWRNNNKEKIKKDNRKWREENKEYIKKYRREWFKNKRLNDDVFNLRSKIYCLIFHAFKNINSIKSKRTEKILGRSFSDFKDFLNKNEYGITTETENIDLDHIIPISTAKTEEEVMRLNHYSNFQLLPSKYNRYVKKANEWDKERFDSWIKKHPNPIDWGV